MLPALEEQSKKRSHPPRAEHARKKAQRLENELASSSQLVQRLIEANRASTYAASLQADLNKDLLSFSRSRTAPRPRERVKEKSSPVPHLHKQPVVTTKTTTPPTENSQPSLQGRIATTPALQNRITTTPTPLVDRLDLSSPNKVNDEIDYNSSNPFGFQPQEFDNLPDEKYSPSVAYQGSSSATSEKPINFYRDTRRRSQHRR